MLNLKREYISLERDRFLYPVSFTNKSKCNVYGRKKFTTEAGETELSAHVFLISKDFWTFNAGSIDFTNYADGIWNDYISISIVESEEYAAPSINFGSMGDITPENLQALSDYISKHLSDLEKRIVEDYLFIDEGAAENLELPNLPENHFWVRKNGVIVGVNVDYIKHDYDNFRAQLEKDFNDFHDLTFEKLKETIRVWYIEYFKKISEEFRGQADSEINRILTTSETQISKVIEIGGKQVEAIIAEGEKQLEAIVGAGGGLATRVDDLESDNVTNKQNITDLENNKLNKGTVSSEYDTAKKIEDKIVNLKDTKQNKTDNALKTTAKQVVPAINELHDDVTDLYPYAPYKGEYNEGTSYNIGDVVMVKGHEPCYVFETINPEMSDPRSIMMFKKVYRIEDKMYYTKQKDGWEIIFPKEEGISFYTIPQKGTEQQYFSTVDNYFPYSKIGRVLLKNGVEQYECDFNDSTKKKGGGTANLTGTDGDVMIRIPKFYSEVKYVPQGIRYRIFSYENPTKKIALGIKPHPYFLKPDGKTYYDVRYQGAYKASLKNGVLASVSGVSPLVSKTMANFIDYAQQGRTNDYSIGNYIWKSVQFMLYIVEFGSLNSQDLFGQGRSNTSSASATGTTNALGNRSGRISTDDANGNVSYRGLEDVWGNIWEFDAGFFATNDGYYITNNPAYYLNKANMTHYNVNLTVDKGDNFISEIERIEGAEYLVLPKTLKGSATTYYCDQLWSHNPGQENISLSGGSWAAGARYGVLCLIWHAVASHGNADIGARLSYARK